MVAVRLYMVAGSVYFTKSTPLPRIINKDGIKTRLQSVLIIAKLQVYFVHERASSFGIESFFFEIGCSVGALAFKPR